MPTLSDIIVDAIEALLKELFSGVSGMISKFSGILVGVILDTPHPDGVFARPNNQAWPGLYDYYWETIIPLALFLWALSIGLVIFFESTSHLFSSYHRSKLKRRAFSGLLGILAWWWIAALSLRFVDSLTGFIVPNLSEISLFETLSFGAIGTLGLVVSLSADLILFILIALIYLARQLALYLFVLMMPVLIVFWIPGVGPFTLVSKFMKKLAGFYVPFLFMTVPVAFLFRIGEILGNSVQPDLGGIGAWLVALVIPILAVVAPLVLFWQAGAIFFMADRAATHTSGSQATSRVATARAKGQESVDAGGNFRRGLRGENPVSDGQMRLGSGGSRAHRAGTTVRSTATSLRDRLSTGSDGSAGGAGGGSDGERAGSRDTTQDSRSTDFSDLREDRRGSDGESETDQSTTESDDETPRYIY